MDGNTIIQGKKELMALGQYQQIPEDKQRRPGGGRKKTAKHPEVTQLLMAFVESHKAGSPTQYNVYWISLKPSEVSKLFYEKHQKVNGISLDELETRARQIYKSTKVGKK